jgi:catechol-2,3-dioxygenase
MESGYMVERSTECNYAEPTADRKAATMAIHRLNHAVLYVRDVARSVAFYQDVLDFEVVMRMGGQAAFLRAPQSSNDHDLGLFGIGAQAGASPAGRATVGLYHLAWEVDTLRDLEALAARLAEAGALVGTSDHSTTKSLYAQDPDGLEFEVAWVVPADQLDDTVLAGRSRIRPLDIAREIARYGADTPGGIGISRTAVG